MVSYDPSGGNGQLQGLGSLGVPTQNNTPALNSSDHMLLQQLYHLVQVLQRQAGGCLNEASAASPSLVNLCDISSSAQQFDPGYAIMDDEGHEEEEGEEEFDDEDEDDDREDASYHGSESRKSKTDISSIGMTESAPSPQSRPHAAVEKKYRRAVNTKLQQLYASIPPSGQFTSEPVEWQGTGAKGRATEQAAKPLVLDKAIQYATNLLDTYRKYDEDIEDLRRKVRVWLDEGGDGQLPRED